MHPTERAELARRTYQRAVEIARGSSTPATWRRLLAAARNLHDAKVEREAALRPGRAPLAARLETRVGAPARAASSAPSPRSVDRDGGAERSVAALQPRLRRSRWPELEEELQRALILREQSRKLVAQARRLRDELAELFAAFARSQSSSELSSD